MKKENTFQGTNSSSAGAIFSRGNTYRAFLTPGRCEKKIKEGV